MLKLDIFQIFITLLFIFIFCIVVYKTLAPKHVENFTVRDSELFKPYSSTNKLTPMSPNEPIFFDEINGNIVIQCMQKNNGGYTLTNDIIVLDRNGNYTDYSLPANMNINELDQISGLKVENTMPSSYKSWIFPAATNTNILSYNFPFQIIYIPSDKDTYIQLIYVKPIEGFPEAKGFGSISPGFFFSVSGARNVNDVTKCQLEIDKINKLVPQSAYVASDNDNQYIVDTFYDEAGIGLVYQMSVNVEFDIYNGNIMISDINNEQERFRKMTVYNRINGSTVGNNSTYTIPQQILDTTASIAPNYTLNNWITVDVLGQNMVLYMGMSQNTVIAILEKDAQDPNGELFKLINVKRFDSNGNVIDGSSTGGGGGGGDIKCQNNQDDDYLKWYWYWVLNGNPNAGWDNSCGSAPVPKDSCGPAPVPKDSCGPAPVTSTSGCPYDGNNDDYFNKKNSDYILKTEIVPPVCPAFPAFLVNVQGSGWNQNSNCIGSGKRDDDRERRHDDDNDKDRRHDDDNDKERRHDDDDDKKRRHDDDDKERRDDNGQSDDGGFQKDVDTPVVNDSIAPPEEHINVPQTQNSSGSGSSYAPANYLPVSNQGFVRPYTPGGSDYMPVTNSFSAFGR